MVSTGLAQSRSLHDLLDLNPPGFRNMQLRVSNGTTELFTTAPAQWWTQPVELITGGETLSTAGTIYVLAQDASGAVTITADQVGLVVVPSARLTNTESSTNVPTLRADNRSRLWIEGKFKRLNATMGTSTVDLRGVDRSVLRRVHAANTPNGGPCFNFDEATRRSLIEDTTATECTVGYLVRGADLNFTRFTAAGWLGNGMVVSGSRNHFLTGRLNSSSDPALLMDRSSRSPDDNVFVNLLLSNSYSAGMVASMGTLGIAGTVLFNVTAASNGGTAGQSGVTLAYTSRPTVVGLLSLNNSGSGLRLFDVQDLTFWDGAIGSNEGSAVDADYLNGAYFNGVLKLFGNGAPCTVATTTGLGQDCSSPSPSAHTRTINEDPASSVVGRATSAAGVGVTAANAEHVPTWSQFSRAWRG